jgi:hypothetical protein
MYEYAEARVGSIPPRALNGGLYTGEAFQRDGGWGNVPIVPDTNNYIRTGLTIGNTPPPGARSQTIADRASSKHQQNAPTVYINDLDMSFPEQAGPE